MWTTTHFKGALYLAKGDIENAVEYLGRSDEDWLDKAMAEWIDADDPLDM
jgi:hypothetical protein